MLSPRDLAAVRGLVADFAAGSRAGDPAVLSRHLAPQVFVVNVFGATIQGRDEVVRVLVDGVHRMFGDAPPAYRIVEVTPAADHIALVRLRIGGDQGGVATVALWVLVLGEAGWQVRAMQGTLASVLASAG